MGLEPTTTAMARRYSSQLSYIRKGCIYTIDFLKNATLSKIFLLHGKRVSIYYGSCREKNTQQEIPFLRLSSKISLQEEF